MKKRRKIKKRKITVDDLQRFRFVSDPQISPEGDRVAFVLTQVDPKKDRYISEIWVSPVKRGAPRKFTRGPKDSYPRWSPDGKWLLFLSGRDDEKQGQQIWILPREGGEATRLTKIKGGVSNPIWSPDSKKILFLASPSKKKKSDVKIMDRILYKINGMGFIYDKRWHLFTVSIRGGAPKQLTAGDFDVNTMAWSPLGKWIVFVSNLEKDSDMVVERNIYRIPAQGGKPKKLAETKGPIEQISYSPSGEWIAYFGHDMRKKFVTDAGVWVIPGEGGEPKELTRGWGHSTWVYVNSDSRVSSPTSPPVFSPDSKKIFMLAGDGGSAHLYSVDFEGKIERILGGKRTIEGFSFSKDFKTLVFSYMDATHLAEVYVAGRDNFKEETKLTRFNDRLFRRLNLNEPDNFSFKSSDGLEIEGWILFPPRIKKGARTPLVLEIHGGPCTAYGYAFEHEFHLLVASGYAVLFVNPRGSSGYGEDFAFQVIEKWGEDDYKDLMAAVDYVLERYKSIDSSRLGVTGGSYGGYMTNWIVSHTDRFKAAVTQRSVTNLFSFVGSSDFGYLFNYELGDFPWESEKALKNYLEHSPIWFVKNIKTPLLIIHSEEDHRCPISQAEEFYAALKILERKVRFVRFPEENHELSRSGKPKHRMERLRHIIGWFDEHLKARRR